MGMISELMNPSKHQKLKIAVNNVCIQAIGYTLEPYYDRMDDEDVLHVFYNDEVSLFCWKFGNSSRFDSIVFQIIVNAIQFTQRFLAGNQRYRDQECRSCQ